jgi:UDP-2,4-diacetamido-2,4,6-trideoxy-beta-L-altropyranose hydrolase
VSAPRVLFVADAGATVGGGHVMRSLTLAGAMVAAGASTTFLAKPAVARILDRFAPPCVELRASDAAEPEAVAGAAAEAARDFDLVVFDCYGLGRDAHLAARDAGAFTVAIDDLADRPLGASVIVDPGLAHGSQDYEGLVEDGADLLLGPVYALVRPEFFERRAGALERRARGEPPARVLVAMGLTDVGGITDRVVGRVSPRLSGAVLDVVVGSAAPSLPSLRRLAERDPAVTLHVDTDRVAELAAQADVAVGAGGSSAWERCVVGLPGVIVTLAANQVPSALAMEAAGATAVVDAAAEDFDACFDRAFSSLMRSAERRLSLSRASAALCDGLGAVRTADAVLSAAGFR